MTTSTTRTRRPRPDTPPLSAQPSVLAIVVTHQGRRWLRESLVGIASQTYPALDVLVIDDASPDLRQPPHLKRIVKRHLRRRRWGFVRTPRPLGFGAAINWALSRVRTDAELLLFVHDDAALSKDSATAMVERLRAEPATAIVGPKILSWDDPDVLEEVGMASDQFGYPYKGLEDGEIDLGQHDVASEVFYVTSTVMMVRHEVFRQLQGWDAGMRAFAEDLDLCWRARVAGHIVRVEPRASARHAIALATGERRSPFLPARYYIRRNRLRALIKNASGVRVLPLVPAFLLLTLIEMLGFILLRQPAEVLNLTRALLWNIGRFPQTLAERARVQRRRRIPDRALRHLMVGQNTRLRFYLSQQAERIEQVWGRRTEILSRRGVQARTLAERMRGWPGAVAAAGMFGLFLGFRHFLFAPPASLGELLPYPDSATALWRAVVAPWQTVGLGQPGPAAPAHGILGVFPILTLGATGAAQKLLVLGLGAVAFVGAYRLVADLVDRHGRVVTAFAYAFGAVGYAALRQGRLGALFFGAAAPFVLRAILRLNGWMRPPGWRPPREVAKVALGGAVTGAFVPGALFLYLLAAAVLTGARAMLGGGERPLRGLTSSAFGLVVGWALLLPWSATWWSPGGALDLLTARATRAGYASSYAGDGMLSTVLGQTPRGLSLLGVALPLLGILAALIASGQRRRAALALWGVVLSGGLVVTAVSAGLVAPVVASPVEAGVLPALSFAALAGLAVGAFRLDLPRRGLGLGHAVAVGVLAIAGFLAAASVAPALLAGGWRAGTGAAVANAHVVDQIASALAAEVEDAGPFRTLWVGERWGPPRPSVARPVAHYFVSGARGPSLGDLFERTRDPADLDLARVVASIEDRSTDSGGRLLGAFNIHYVVIERGSRGEGGWLSQRDLGIARREPDYFLLENDSFLPRAAVYEEIPPAVEVVGSSDPSLAARAGPPTSANLDADTGWRYERAAASGPGVIFLAEQNDAGWHALLDGVALERVDGTWGNAFAMSDASAGPLMVVRPRGIRQIVGLIVMLLAWLVVIAAAFSRTHTGAIRRRHVGRRSSRVAR